MERYWFKAKRYGWGWYPATWQGGVVMVVWIIFFVAGEVTFINRIPNGPQELLWFIPYTVFIIAALTYVAYKTGEPPRWRWGEKEPGDDK